MNTQLLSIGEIKCEADCKEIVEDYNATRDIYKKFFFQNDILKGVILVGDISKSVAVIKGVREEIRKNQIITKLYN